MYIIFNSCYRAEIIIDYYDVRRFTAAGAVRIASFHYRIKLEKYHNTVFNFQLKCDGKILLSTRSQTGVINRINSLVNCIESEKIINYISERCH